MKSITDERKIDLLELINEALKLIKENNIL